MSRASLCGLGQAVESHNAPQKKGNINHFCVFFTWKTLKKQGRATMKELEEIMKCKDVSLETSTKIIHTLIFSVTMYGCGSWTVKKADRKKN